MGTRRTGILAFSITAVLAGATLAGASVLSATPAASPGASPVTVEAPTADAPSVRGTWIITPAGAPFTALAAFAAGGSFVTTGSDQPGTGIGQWVADGADGFAFSYQNFHFGPDGALTTITTVNATGTFEDDTMAGTATEVVVDASGASAGMARTMPFTGTRMKATAP